MHEIMERVPATRPLIPEASPEEGSMVLFSDSQVGTSVRMHQGTFLSGGHHLLLGSIIGSLKLF